MVSQGTTHNLLSMISKEVVLSLWTFLDKETKKTPPFYPVLCGGSGTIKISCPTLSGTFLVETLLTHLECVAIIFLFARNWTYCNSLLHSLTTKLNCHFVHIDGVLVNFKPLAVDISPLCVCVRHLSPWSGNRDI